MQLRHGKTNFGSVCFLVLFFKLILCTNENRIIKIFFAHIKLFMGQIFQKLVTTVEQDSLLCFLVDL